MSPCLPHSPGGFPDFQDCYQQVLDDLETLTQRVEKLQVDGAVPDWAVTRGKLLLQRWSVCLDQ